MYSLLRTATRVLRREASSTTPEAAAATAAAVTTRPLAPGKATDVIVGEEKTPTVEAHAPSWNTDIAHTSGQPVKQANRHVNIFQPTKTAMQMGTFQTRYWSITFDTEGRWENPLMGWTSSADPLQAVDLTLRFSSKEAAVAFAERNGWSYTVTETQRRNVSIRRQYADNFRYVPGKLRLVKTK